MAYLSNPLVNSAADTLLALEQQANADPSNIKLRKHLAGIYRLTAQNLQDQCAINHEVDKMEAVRVWRIKALEALSGSIDPEHVEDHFTLALVEHHLGNTDRSCELVEQALRIQDQLADLHPLNKFNIRVLQTRSCTASNIGHLMPEPEFFMKRQLLGWNPPYHGVLLLRKQDICNRAAINYWRKEINVITDEQLIEYLKPLQESLEYNTFWCRLPTGKVVYYWSGLVAVQRTWESKGGGALLKLSEQHHNDGWEELAKYGVPRGAWFVALHARDQGRGKNGMFFKTTSTAHRDCDIDTYKAAIEEITSRGGWVIRMGDATMKELPHCDHAIDYAHSPIKSDWMDLFLISQCKFLLGSASGVNGMPFAFGVPSCLTNMSPMNIVGVTGKDLFIPKLMRDLRTKELLRFDQGLIPKLNYCCNGSFYDHNGVEHVDNTPEELREIVVEMFERLEGRAEYSSEDDQNQARFQSIINQFEPYGISSRIGREFLRRHKYLL